MKHLVGHILTKEGWHDGWVEFDRRIVAIGTSDAKSHADGPYIVPGFIDLHVPGGGGSDAMDGPEAVRQLARTHAAFGTTALAPTMVTAPHEDLMAAAAGIAQVQADRRTGEARVLGAHVEGPFLNEARLGAQPPFATAPDPALMDRLMETVEVKIATLAPELEGALDLIRRLTDRGVAVQIGHSDATYEIALAAFDAGATGFTHLFNAMSPMHHRSPGVAGAALARATYAALIPDFQHVHEGAVRAALRAIPKLFCVTDAGAAAGMPDGQYTLGRARVTQQGDAVHLVGGTTGGAAGAAPVLAGSALTMDRALSNLLSLGLALDDAVARLSTYPAEFLGIGDRGELAPGNWADLVVLDKASQVDRVFVEGEEIDRSR